jgi:release factor glutamine methyltransferase
MSQTDTWTIGRLLTWTTEYLQKQGAQTPRLDAELLLARARGCERIELYTAFQDEADSATRDEFRDLVRRRAAGTPVAYLLGSREFYSLSCTVTPDVLIPRPETEFVVVELLDRAAEYSSQNGQLRIADVGTGSGILAICAARHLAGCRVVAVDICPRALNVARQNAATHGVSERIDFCEGDLLSGVAEAERFDFIVSNPPYVSEAEFEQLEPEVRLHEPRVALLAGATGLEVAARLVPQASERLVPGGWLILEISPMIEARVVELLAETGCFHEPRRIQDLAHLPRVIACRRTG